MQTKIINGNACSQSVTYLRNLLIVRATEHTFVSEFSKNYAAELHVAFPDEASREGVARLLRAVVTVLGQ